MTAQDITHNSRLRDGHYCNYSAKTIKAARQVRATGAAAAPFTPRRGCSHNPIFALRVRNNPTRADTRHYLVHLRAPVLRLL
jgi:hypothetical protein